MATLLGKSIYRSTFARAVLLGLMALCGAASPLLGQETVAGKFTLTESTRLGKSFLPAGAYTFSIEPVGILQSVSSIQGARQIVQVIVRPETKAGPVAAIFAMATRSAMYLDKQGLVLDFDWWSPKDKTQILAQAARPEPVSGSKATD